MKFSRGSRTWRMLVSAAALVSAAFADGLRPPPEITVSQWADQYRIVAKPSPKPGPWQTSVVPYAREIMDRLSPSDPCEIVALMKAAQGAGSEIGINALGCWMHIYPDSTMVVCPTIDAAKKFSHIRLDRVFESTPVLREIVAAPRGRDANNSVLLKEFGEGRDSLVLTGANSGVGLRSYPSKFAICEEVDGYPLDLDGEGPPMDLIIQRTGAYDGRKIYANSTPTLAGFSAIHHLYEMGDQNALFIPCPLCGRPQILIFGEDRVKTGQPGGLRWPKGSPELVRYQCEFCGDQWEEWRKTQVLDGGVWIPQRPGNGGGLVRSYHISALPYPYGWPGNAWKNLAAEWERDHANPVKRKSFWNLKLGLPWSDPAEVKADAKSLMARCEAYGPEIPAGVGVLLAGVDVQANRIEAELVGWGIDEESWSIEYRRFLGDTGNIKNPVWAELDDWLKGEWLSELGLSMSIRAACIDSGYNQETVRQFCYEHRGRNIWAIKGKEGYGRPVWPTKLGKQRGKLPPPFIVGVDAAKEIVYARLKMPAPGPGFCHFPAGRDLDYFEMLTSEVRVPDYTGPVPTYEWKKKTAATRNEALDARDYVYACLQGLTMTTAFRLNREVEKLRAMAEAKRTGAARPTASIFRAPAPMVSDDPYLN